jgi:hypothetical protein
MSYVNYSSCISLGRLFLLSILFPVHLFAETKTWTGYGGDSNWLNPLNWSGITTPVSTDDILLDNGDLPVSYQVRLPDIAIVLRTLCIRPSPGRNIELILPASNTRTNALSVTGPGYGIELFAGAIFRNASGINSGESLSIADSIIIRDGARYIHQTRSSHANSILRILSTAPGTEQGIFDFDVPRASYTISVSNRIYGSLELHSAAQGSQVNLAGVNGNIYVAGDFIQEGGQLNLSSGSGDSSILRIMGDLYQSAGASVTESSDGNPFIELNGNRKQEIAFGGQILNQVGVRLNNIFGAILRLPLRLPWKMDFVHGALTSSETAMIILDTGCTLSIDSSRMTGSYVDGPMRKLGLNQNDYFLFPVGKDDNLRWLELKNGSGNYTVEYFRQNPAIIGTAKGPGLDHISKLEYWKVLSDGEINDLAKIELSFASIQSGGVTDPNYLNVAKFQNAQWLDAGHTSFTGNAIQGSVLSGSIDFKSQDYTLASTLNLENPLPLTIISLQIKELDENLLFSWSVKTSETIDHFELNEETGGEPKKIGEIKAVHGQSEYSWIYNQRIGSGNHYFRINMKNVHGELFKGDIVQINKRSGITLTQLVSGNNSKGSLQLLIQCPETGCWLYEIVNINGKCIGQGELALNKGKNLIYIGSGFISKGTYVFHAIDASGNNHSALFIIN